MRLVVQFPNHYNTYKLRDVVKAGEEPEEDYCSEVDSSDFDDMSDDENGV